MSTKTTFKRIALVTVAALGFGMLSTVTASAAALTVGATASIATDTPSITLIAAGATPAATEYGVFEVSLTNSSGYAAPLQSGESMTATVISTPGASRGGTDGSGTGSTLPADLSLKWSTDYVPTARTITSALGAGTTLWASAGTYSTLGKAYDDMSLSANLRGGTDDATTGYTTDASTATATYALGVYATADKDLLDAGFYTIRIRALDSSGNTLTSKDVKFQVASKGGSGAALTATVTGSHATPTVGGRVNYTTTQNFSATLADANGGRVVELENASPTLSATVKDAGTTTVVTDTLTMSDTGTALTTTDASSVVGAVFGDGVYHATLGTLTGIAGTGTFTVRYGDAVATASVVMTGANANYGKTSVTATGKVANATTATNYDVPLTTKSATVKITTVDGNTSAALAVPSAVVYYTLAYSAGCVLGDMAPAKVGTLTKATSDANGVFSIEITNANPIDNCTATVVFSGPTNYTGSTGYSLTRAINWTKPVATTAVVNPAGNYSAVLASTHKITWTITDQFGAAVVGSTVQFSHTGANKPASTTSAASAISDANGQVSYTWTDAKGVVDSTTLGSDTVALASVGTTTFAKGSITVTYVATMPAIASLYSTYTATNAAGTTITGLVPTTAIGGTTGVLTSTADQIDSAKTVTGATTGAWVRLNFQARKAAATTGTSGVPTTVTVTGAQLIGNDGKLGSTVTVYANENVHVLGTKSGTATVKATNGTITSTATINFINDDSDARVLKLTESNGLVTATVTDAFGSPVEGVSVAAVGSGGAWLGNGSTSSTFTTAADGTVTFAVTGAGTVKASLSSTTYAKTTYLAGSGDALGVSITTGAPAGVGSASVSTSGTTQATDVAQTAADAAAEATDAANAATDAANAAAEAADAATAAAQDAADAVAALSAQVSAMITSLKAQLTALTNLVIKIQKKVKA